MKCEMCPWLRSDLTRYRRQLGKSCGLDRMYLEIGVNGVVFRAARQSVQRSLLWESSNEQRLGSESGTAATMYVKGVEKWLTGNTRWMSRVYTMSRAPDQQTIVSMVPRTRSCVWLRHEKLESCPRVGEIMPTQGRVGCTNESRRCSIAALRPVFKVMQGALWWPLGEFGLHNLSLLLVGKAR